VVVVVVVHYTSVTGVHASEVASILAAVIGCGVMHTLHFAGGRGAGAAHFLKRGAGHALKAVLWRRCGLEGRRQRAEWREERKGEVEVR